MLAAIPDAVLAAPLAFVFGAAAGFVVGARYRIEKRNGKDT